MLLSKPKIENYCLCFVFTISEELKSTMYFEISISILLLSFFLETWLNARQHKRLYSKKMPVEIENYISRGAFFQLQPFRRTKNIIHSIKNFFTLLQNVFDLIFIGHIISCCRYILEFLYIPRNELNISVMFVILYYSKKEFISFLFSFFEKLDSKSKLLSDFLRTICIIVIMSLPACLILTRILEWTDISFWFYSFLIQSCASVISRTAYYEIYLRLFKRIKSIDNCPLKEEIHKLTSYLKISLGGVYISKDQHNCNTVAIFGYNDILLGDLSINCPNKTVLTYLCHQVGHKKNNHYLKKFTLDRIRWGLFFYLLYVFIQNYNIYYDFGFVQTPSTMIRISIFSIVHFPINNIVRFILDIFSRNFELQADDFVIKVYNETDGFWSDKKHDLEKDIISLYVDNFEDLNLDPWYSLYFFGELSLIQRLKNFRKKLFSY